MISPLKSRNIGPPGRRRFLQAAALAAMGLRDIRAQSGPSGKDLTLLAHRGAVSAQAPENTAPALEGAVREGYWMAEIDLRATADGQIILNHDKDFSRIYGVNRTVSGSNWSEIRRMRSVAGQANPILFEDAVRIVRDHIGLWLDIKEKPASPKFLSSVERTLRENRLLDRTWVGIHPQASDWFKGKARLAATVGDLFGLVQDGVDISQGYILNESLGFAMSERTVKWGLSKGVPVMPFIGSYHYPGANGMAEAAADIRFLLKAGVNTFMIDSIYRSNFPAAL